MSLDRELRDVLAERAERAQPPPANIDVLMAGGLARRRHRRQIVVATTALAILVAIAGGLAAGRGLGLWDTRADDPVDQHTPWVVGSTRVPWCLYGSPERIVGAGTPLSDSCSATLYPEGEGLWHQASSTILVTSRGSVYRVADGQLTRLGAGYDASGVVKMSHDGRYVAWITAEGELTDHEIGCPLTVYEVPSATEVARIVVPAPPGAVCSGVDGIDDLGRVYVTMSEEGSGAYEIWMYDPQTGESTQVTGIPAGTGEIPAEHLHIRYVTADGFAVFKDDYVSIEGVVDAEGRFVHQREVPVGRGLWSPDRSQFVEPRPEGVVVRPAADLASGEVLELPAQEFVPLDPMDLVTLQWESASSVLVSGPFASSGYRCDVRSGECRSLRRDGELALGNFWGHELPPTIRPCPGPGDPGRCQ